MSGDVQAALDQLGLVLAQIPELNRVITNAVETPNTQELPLALLTLAPAVPHTWRVEAMGLGRHDYMVSLWLIVGRRDLGLPELLSRTTPWPKRVADALLANMTLVDTVAFIGAGDDDNTFFTYDIGEIAWGGSQLFGLTFHLPITQKVAQTMG